jgi:hypothetical protein
MILKTNDLSSGSVAVVLTGLQKAACLSTGYAKVSAPNYAFRRTPLLRICHPGCQEVAPYCSGSCRRGQEEEGLKKLRAQ